LKSSTVFALLPADTSSELRAWASADSMGTTQPSVAPLSSAIRQPKQCPQGRMFGSVHWSAFAISIASLFLPIPAGPSIKIACGKRFSRSADIKRMRARS